MVKKAQIFSADLTISFVIFLAFMLIGINKWNAKLNELDELRNTEKLWFEGGILMETLFTQGNPENWTLNAIKTIGLTNKPNYLDKHKLELFINYSKTNYDTIKKEIGINEYEYNLKVAYLNGTLIYDQENNFNQGSEVIRLTRTAFLDKHEFKPNYEEVIVELIVWRV